jgi:hypothetical protein
MPQLGDVNLAIGDFLATPAGLLRPSHRRTLREVRESISGLNLSTSRPGALTAEHIDLCSYRLDACTAFFAAARCSQRMREPEEASRRGVHLAMAGSKPAAGAPLWSWQKQIPVDLRETVAWSNNRQWRFIHGPINHAVRRRVHNSCPAPPISERQHFAVNLTSGAMRRGLPSVRISRISTPLGVPEFARCMIVTSWRRGVGAFILVRKSARWSRPDHPGCDRIHRSEEACQVVDGYAPLENVF